MGIRICAGHMYYGNASRVLYYPRLNRIDLRGGLFRCDKVNIEDIESIEEADEDMKRIGGAFGWGLAALLSRGKGKDTVFIISLKNGYVTMCQGPTKEYTELKAALMQHALKASS